MMRIIVSRIGARVEELDSNSSPNLYERIDLERRFIHLAGYILEKDSKKSEDDSQQFPQSASWRNKSEGYSFTLRREVRMHSYYSVLSYILEHYIDELPPTQPLARYAISVDVYKTSPIVQLDQNNTVKRVSPEDSKIIARQAMSILIDHAPAEASRHLNQMVDTRFERLAAAYILSDHAVKKDDEEAYAVDSKSTEKAMVKHLKRELSIMEDVAQQNADESAAKQETIDEAINEKPRRSGRRRGDFTDPDTINVTRLFAEHLRPKWTNTVQPDQ